MAKKRKGVGLPDLPTPQFQTRAEERAAALLLYEQIRSGELKATEAERHLKAMQAGRRLLSKRLKDKRRD